MNGDVEFPGCDWLFVHDLVNHRRYILSGERFFAGDHLVEKHAGRKKVAAAVEFVSSHLLRRHVVRSTHHFAGVCEAGSGLGNAEVHDLHHAIGGDHDVRWLDVAMDHFAEMRVLESGTDLGADIDDLL